jgi:AraC family transcriptional regulator, transcriptional activator of pobA
MNNQVSSVSNYQTTGHFNVYRLSPYINKMPWFKEFYNIRLTVGNILVSHSLSISNPKMIHTSKYDDYLFDGTFCIFDRQFLYQYPCVMEYEIFRHAGEKACILSDHHFKKVSELYESMFEEIKSDYMYKYDVLRIKVFELLHFMMKIQQF